jgi:aminopeptidase N
MVSKLSALLVVILALASTHIAQRPDFNRPQTYDAQHYLLNVRFDHAKRTVFGDVSVRIRPLKEGFREARFDAVGLKFESVKLGLKDLKYRADGKTIAVTLDRDYKTGEDITIRFKYSANPKKGVYFVDEKKEKDKVIHSAQIWTQGESEEARHWFPSFDHPSDKATTEQIITVKTPNTVIGNGELLSETKNADGTATFHYKMPVPHSTYLVSFIVGEYEKFVDKYGDVDVTLTNYLYPNNAALNKNAYGKTKDILKAFEELTGVKYPFNKYDQTIVGSFAFGGMENITATTMADTEIAFANLDFLRGNVEDLVSHELAHSWFGNNVTAKNWAELWLNEGFATFMEAAVREKLYGRNEYIRKIGVDVESFMADDEISKGRFGLFNLTAANTDKLFDRPAVTYNKGSVVVHMLREQVGDANFWKAINLYLTRHRFANVETTDLQRAMEETSGQKLDWFFAQWVYGTSYAKLNIKQRYDEPSKSLVFDIEQTQKGDLVPTAFRLPLDIQIKFPDGHGPIKTERLEITDRKQTISIPVPTKPETVTFDPDTKLPLVAIKPTGTQPPPATPVPPA